MSTSATTTALVRPVPRPASAAAALLDSPAARVVGFALLTAVCAQVKLYVPGNPTPLTMQTLAVALAAVCLPWRQGVASMALYAGLGLAGLPVFADFRAGLGALSGATGGYVLGFLLAPLAAQLALRGAGRPAWWRVLAAAALAHAAVFAVGVPWVKLAMGWTWAVALVQGFPVFLPGTIVKSALAAAIARR